MDKNQGHMHKNGYIKNLIINLVILLIAVSVVMILSQAKRKDQVNDAMFQIGAIYNSCKMFFGDQDRWPGSIEELLDGGYLSLHEETAGIWDFRIIGLKSIVAESKEDFVDGEGFSVVYALEPGQFSFWKNGKIKRYLFVD